LRHSRSGVDGPEKFERANEVRGETQQPPSLTARLEDEMKVAMFEVAQAAMHES
jgi:hypothetical protein